MAEEVKKSIFKEVVLNPEKNNTDHHTCEITGRELIVRRGQPFSMTLKLTQSFQSDLYPLKFVAKMGENPSEEKGTLFNFGIPENVTGSPLAMAAWKTQLKPESSPEKGILHLDITPPANALVGQYLLTANHRDEDITLALATVLFNPWCPEDSVYLPVEDERYKYVMEETGLIYVGSVNHCEGLKWDYGQFEDDMVKICMQLLDIRNLHEKNPEDDSCHRGDPVYVGRVVSAMINSGDDYGVLEGNWSESYEGGFSPSHWSGSHPILNSWYKKNCHPVKYGQCWVFAGVMCSVMRLLGIPCRVVTNFGSAHDTNKNLTIDVYHTYNGVAEKMSHDSIWNFHVWVEGWMNRPDLGLDGKFNGWQVLDPTPQEMSNGRLRCGPAPVNAILNGEVKLDYDVPFVFAEVNADCVDWLIMTDGSKIKLFSDSKRVGADTVTESLEGKKESLKTNYKYEEGSEKERAVFKYALAKNEADTSEGTDEVTPEVITPIALQINEVTEPRNGQDVKLELVLHSESTTDRELSIVISAQAIKHNGTPAENILKNEIEKTLQPGKKLTIPILIPYNAYKKPMMKGESMKVSALVRDLREPDNGFMEEDNIFLIQPTLFIFATPSKIQKGELVNFKIIFKNPANEKLKRCTLTLSGSGIIRDETTLTLPDLLPKMQYRINIQCKPYKTGKKTFLADIDCKTFKDIKGHCDITVNK